MQRELKNTVRLLSLVSMLGALSITGSAHAQLMGINVPESDGRFFIGNWLYWTFAIFEPGDGGDCTTWLLGNGALTDDILVRGTSGPDTMEVFDVPGVLSNEICGVRLAAVNRNGFAVMLFGEGGEDHLTSGDYMLGGSGHDVLDTEGHSLAETGLAYLDGGEGPDHLISSVNDGATLIGGTEADKLCILDSSTAELIDGGSGADKFRGSADRIVSASAVSLATCLAGQ